MKEVLLLRYEGDTNLTRENDVCDIAEYYSKNPKCNYYKNLKEFLFKIVNKLGIVFYGQNFLSKSWRYKVNQYNKFILFDCGYSTLVTKYIKKHNKNCKIILWNWNPCTEEKVRYFQNDKNIDEIWTYDKRGADEFNLSYNSQFYNKNIKLNEKVCNFDIVFLGANKNRNGLIKKYQNIFEKKDIKCKFKIVNSNNENISYEKYLEFISDGKILLDIVTKDVTGITLRIMEGLFFNKKVITNNQTIKEYDFYNENNFFIIENDNFEYLDNFIKSDYIPTKEEILERYDFENWIKRF